MATDVDALLATHFGFPALRPLQQRVIDPVIAGRDVLAVLPTGGGKSLCYQLPALTVPGATIVVSPLIALMQDQVQRLESRQIAAAMLAGEVSADQRAAVLERMARRALRLVYISPERLAGLVDQMVARGIRVDRIAVDEAHCVVEWGHDFRPAYRRIGVARDRLGQPPCTALTGTATPAVRDEIIRSLGLRDDRAAIVGSFDRPNLRFQVQRVHNTGDRLRRLVRAVRRARGTVIVYGPTRNMVEGLTHVLRDVGVSAAPYHAGMAAHERRTTLDRFLDDSLSAVVATSAFGMGIDKPDVRLVVHWTAPASPEAYYQEAGRAGRDGAVASCLMFTHPGDAIFPRHQLEQTYPDERVVESLWRTPALRDRHPAALVASADRLAEELHPERGAVNWAPVRRRRREAEHRLQAMQRYATTRRCRRETLLDWFGEPLRRCAGCDNCDPELRGLE